MRRWNGWGDVSIFYPLADSAVHYLAGNLGLGTPAHEISLKEIVQEVPASRLPDKVWIDRQPVTRVLHACGQSLPDWIALRLGQVPVFPDGVAFPKSTEEVRDCLEFAYQTEVNLIPYGGGTSVVGHINSLPGDCPNLCVDLSQMNRFFPLDEKSCLATFEAGVRGPELENQLNALGYTLGHFPQSFEYSTLGGWIATRSAGQQSYYYGRIEDMFAGGMVETPVGSIELKSFPASATGPDLKQIFLGSEGRFGVITHATVRVRPIPEEERFYGVFFPNWEAGVRAAQSIAQEGILVSMLRLSDPQETEVTLALTGQNRLVQWAKRALSLWGVGSQRSLLIFGVTGNRLSCKHNRRLAIALFREHGGIFTGSIVGEHWRKSRFRTPYLRNTLWELGYAVDTVETAIRWSLIPRLVSDLTTRLSEALMEDAERVLVFSHLSHFYRDGASVYVTFIFRLGDTAKGSLFRWSKLKGLASQVIQEHGGTISHQHGIGVDHAHYMTAEKGKLGINALEGIRKQLDPHGLLNPGKLIPTA